MLNKPEFYIGRPTGRRFLRTLKIWGCIILFFLIVGRPYMLFEVTDTPNGKLVKYVGFGPDRDFTVKPDATLPLFRLLW